MLVVDDNLAHARFARALVEDGFPGAEVQYAGRLATAVRRLEGEEIDVVLLDLFLPDSQGAATLEQLIRQAGSAVPVVVVTALVRSSRAFRRLDAATATPAVPAGDEVTVRFGTRPSADLVVEVAA